MALAMRDLRLYFLNHDCRVETHLEKPGRTEPCFRLRAKVEDPSRFTISG